MFSGWEEEEGEGEEDDMHIRTRVIHVQIYIIQSSDE